ncbi:unnamed protein product [Urochloa decumbens]|uniref:F-box domain-containing protein n=1 Tax=Urochloa decumbens TaxID=240449 RepID=A0ABC9D4P8_9POAL
MASVGRQDAGGEDRLSGLPDRTLGHILSFLPTMEAGRAAMLSSRWRDIFASVHTISYVELYDPKTMDTDTWSTFYFDSEERRSTNGNFLDEVNGALLCRRRCAGPETTPLRVFRVSFQDYHHWDKPMVDRWVTYALQQAGGEELHLDLRLHAGVACKCGRSAESDSYEEYFRRRRRRGGRQSSNRLPSRLFSCAALRSLRVAYCSLVPPEEISLPAVETLHLTGVRNPGATIQRLISACPRLVDLTLEGCPEARRVSVLDKRLRRLSLRCCQNLESVAVDASELVAFDYRGTVPPETLLTLHGTPRISSCTVEFCDRIKLFGEDELVRVRKLLDKFADAARYLRLGSRRLGCGMETESSFSGFPTFSALRRLELTGCPESRSTAIALARILEQTPILEALTLFMKPVDNNDPGSKDDVEGDMVTTTTTDAMADFPAQCLRHRLREFNLVHYGGNEAQRKVAEMVLGKALVLQKVCVVFPKAPVALQTSLMNEIKGWVVNKSAKMMFL